MDKRALKLALICISLLKTFTSTKATSQIFSYLNHQKKLSVTNASLAVQPSTTLADNQTNFNSLNSLVETSRATVNGVVTQVSPLKAAKSGKNIL